MSGADKHDPGWNDPPMFSYNPEAVAAKPKNVLNKRVPYSMNSNPAPVQDTNMPLSAPPIGSLLPSTSDLRQNIIDQNMDCDTKVYDFEETINIFKELIYTSPELGKKASDIQKRLQIMETMWREGKLNLDVQTKTSQMAKALKKFDTKTADDIHKSLMVDHVSNVSPWIVGIKQLIFHFTAINELLKIDRE